MKRHCNRVYPIRSNLTSELHKLHSKKKTSSLFYCNRKRRAKSVRGIVGAGTLAMRRHLHPTSAPDMEWRRLLVFGFGEIFSGTCSYSAGGPVPPVSAAAAVSPSLDARPPRRRRPAVGSIPSLVRQVVHLGGPHTAGCRTIN